MYNRNLKAYKTTSLDAEMAVADPHRIIQMLMQAYVPALYASYPWRPPSPAARKSLTSLRRAPPVVSFAALAACSGVGLVGAGAGLAGGFVGAGAAWAVALPLAAAAAVVFSVIFLPPPLQNFAAA